MLNPIRGNTEDAGMVALAYDKSRLLSWYEEQKEIEAYTEVGSPSFDDHGDTHKWHKTFKKGSPLEWYNPMDSEEPNRDGHGIQELWTTEELVQDFLSNNDEVSFVN